MTSDITKDDLFRAVLALDVYHRGYNNGLDLEETGTNRKCDDWRVIDA